MAQTTSGQGSLLCPPACWRIFSCTGELSASKSSCPIPSIPFAWDERRVLGEGQGREIVVRGKLMPEPPETCGPASDISDICSCSGDGKLYPEPWLGALVAGTTPLHSKSSSMDLEP